MDVLNQALDLLGVDDVLKMIKVLSPYGAQIKREMRPYRPDERGLLEADLDLLERFVTAIQKQSQVFLTLRQNISHIKTLDESLENAVQGLALTQVELFEIKVLILILKRVQGGYGQFLSQLPQHLQLEIPSASDLALDPHGDGLETFYIGDHFSTALSDIREQIKSNETHLKRLKQAVAKTLLADYPGLKYRPNGTVVVAKSDQERYLALKQDQRVYVSDEHFETVAFSVMATADMALVNRELDRLKGEEEQACYDVRLKLSGIIASEVSAFEHSLTAMGWLDFYLAKAALAIGVNGTRPVIAAPGTGIEIEEGRHVGLEIRLRHQQGAYTPVSVRFDTAVALITGANMGGKTIALKMVGQVVTLAHFGLFVPAKLLKTPMLHYLTAAIGDEQSIDQGLSTFGSEVLHLKTALNQADREGLILVDELARGTNPQEGLALSKSIVDYLQGKPAYTVITTHFDGLARHDNQAVRHWQVRGLKDVDFSNWHGDQDRTHVQILGDLVALMDYRLEPVTASVGVPRDALHIGQMMGLPEAILESARRHLKET